MEPKDKKLAEDNFNERTSVIKFYFRVEKNADGTQIDDVIFDSCMENSDYNLRVQDKSWEINEALEQNAGGINFIGCIDFAHYKLGQNKYMDMFVQRWFQYDTFNDIQRTNGIFNNRNIQTNVRDLFAPIVTFFVNDLTFETDIEKFTRIEKYLEIYGLENNADLGMYGFFIEEYENGNTKYTVDKYRYDRFVREELIIRNPVIDKFLETHPTYDARYDNRFIAFDVEIAADLSTAHKQRIFRNIKPVLQVGAVNYKDGYSATYDAYLYNAHFIVDLFNYKAGNNVFIDTLFETKPEYTKYFKTLNPNLVKNGK